MSNSDSDLHNHMARLGAGLQLLKVKVSQDVPIDQVISYHDRVEFVFEGVSYQIQRTQVPTTNSPAPRAETEGVCVHCGCRDLENFDPITRQCKCGCICEFPPVSVGEPTTFRTTKEAMEYAQNAGIPVVVPVGEVDGWLDIESAPVNESVLIYIPNAEHYGEGIYRGLQVDMGTGRRWGVSGLHMGRDCGTTWQPTHWMPLPAPPEKESE